MKNFAGLFSFFDRALSAEPTETKEDPRAGAILIAEDNLDDANLLIHYLRRAGVKRPISVVPDGQRAISYIEADGEYSDREKFPRPILLFLDLRMKPVNGLGVLRWLQSNRPDERLPVIVLTAVEERFEVMEAYRLGARTFLTKPVTGQAVVEFLSSFGIAD